MLVRTRFNWKGSFIACIMIAYNNTNQTNEEKQQKINNNNNKIIINCYIKSSKSAPKSSSSPKPMFIFFVAFPTPSDALTCFFLLALGAWTQYCSACTHNIDDPLPIDKFYNTTRGGLTWLTFVTQGLIRTTVN